MIIGGAVIRNGGAKCNLLVENNVPILREKDIMLPAQADTPAKDIIGEKEANTHAKRIYFTIQLMYIDSDNLKIHHGVYWKLVHQLIKAAPSTVGIIDQISEMIVSNHFYKALKFAKELIYYEEEVIRRASKSVASLSVG